MELLEVKELTTVFHTAKGPLASVRELSFSLKPGETLALVGESGCGKSVTSLSIMDLLSAPGEIAKGQILFEKIDLRNLSKKVRRNYRGNKMAMIFQEPMTSLNPVFTIGNQLREIIKKHLRLPKKETQARSLQMLERVGIPDPAKVLKQFPHQLSGGMRQRVMIALALSCSPKLLIADEPTTALDVTIQAQILALLRALSKEENTGVLLITHDLGVVAEMADRVLVMYAGEVVEEAEVFELFAQAKHPYTLGLLGSLPSMSEEKKQLVSIPGSVPNLASMPEGCLFHPRCERAVELCRLKKPKLEQKKDGHWVRCHLVKEEK